MTKSNKKPDSLPLGVLEGVDVRKYWNNEAHDFTPWLADNINLLGEAIGLELEVEEVESRVGNFNADIVCRDEEGRMVIVENQFGKTDHDHLGKLLTYAAGKGAAVIVWIAEEFRDEHRAAIDWLNDNTANDLHAFGVEIELWKICDSPLAPNFNVVSKPNDWTKTTRKTGETSDTEKVRFNFWQGLQDIIAEQKQGKIKSGKPTKDSRVVFHIGRSGFYLTARMSVQKSRIAVQLHMRGPNAGAHYHLLFQQKDEVEKEIGQQLEWRELPNRKKKKVNLWRENCDVKNEQQWGDFHSWLYEYLEKFYAAFSERIKNLDAADWQVPEAQGDDDDNDNDNDKDDD